jgi:3-deoxy-manno-octulosonate cytidylyltransferase (CMP-KDO synthetase)
MGIKVTGVIPARLGSKRFPGKALFQYRSKPLLQYVWDDVRKSKRLDRLVIATDSPIIEKAALGFGAEVFRSHKAHATGTDRVAEVAEAIGGDIVLNIQGDNFGLKGRLLDVVIDSFSRSRGCPFGTIATRIRSDEELFDPNTVKVVVSEEGDALWFSRYPIPFVQNPRAGLRSTQFHFRRHVGVYLFRKKDLRAYASWKRTAIEKAESLEQMRMLERGKRVKVFDAIVRAVSIDCPADVGKLDHIHMSRG